MSCAIIRNEKLKMGQLTSTCRHNERKNKNYGNEDIDPTRTELNYHLIKPIKGNGYEKEFNRIRSEENLKGNLRLTGAKQSNVACEFLITSDNEFFNSVGAEKTKKYFEDALKFAKNKVGEKNIISAVVHMDETTPHMHLVFIPVVQKANSKGIMSNRINCSDFWKGYNSYGILQDEFHKHCIEKGYKLERGEIGSRAKHDSTAEFKAKKRIEKLETEISALKTEKKSLKNENNKLKTQINSYRSVCMRIDEIDCIQPLKAFNGAIKGISVDVIEKLKLQASAGFNYKYKYDHLFVEYNDLNKKLNASIPSSIEQLELLKELKRLQDLEIAVDLLPGDIKNEILSKPKQFKQKNTNLEEL